MNRFAASRGAAVLITLVLMVLISFPVVWSGWNGWRLDKVGVATAAAVTDTQGVPEAKPERWFVRYTLPTEAEVRGGTYIAQVDQATYDEATASKQISATYLKGKPGVNRVEGQVTNRLGLWLTLVADLALVGLLALAVKFRPARQKQVVLLATADVARTRPGFSVTEDGAEVVLHGEIVAMADGEITVLAGPDLRVRVVLGEYRNAVGYQQPVEVRGRRLEP